MWLLCGSDVSAYHWFHTLTSRVQPKVLYSFHRSVKQTEIVTYRKISQNVNLDIKQETIRASLRKGLCQCTNLVCNSGNSLVYQDAPVRPGFHRALDAGGLLPQQVINPALHCPPVQCNKNQPHNVFQIRGWSVLEAWLSKETQASG